LSSSLRLSRLFSNRVIRRYPAFDEFYGMEEVIEQIVAFFRHAAQGQGAPRAPAEASGGAACAD
jgi:predicted Ser/Thr protein kinase